MGPQIATSSVNMVNALFSATGQLFTDMLPLLYLVFGVFLFWFALIPLTKFFIKSLRQATR